MKVLLEVIYGEHRKKITGQIGHHYVKDYEKTDYYCPECGKQEVWECTDEGDYYLGEISICTACSTTHYLGIGGGEGEETIVNQLKTGITAKPTTPKGK